MGVAEILAQIDREIAQLQHARALLSGASNGSAKRYNASTGRKKRRLTPEGRRRIAEAVKKRWAEQRKRSAAGR